jgi:hypothetical protein
MSVIERIVQQLNGKSVLLIYGMESATPTTNKSEGGTAKSGVDE